MTCSYCKNSGHKRTTCPERKRDDCIWKYQQALMKVEKQQEDKLIKEMARQTLLEIMELGFQQQTVIQQNKLKKFTVSLD